MTATDVCSVTATDGIHRFKASTKMKPRCRLLRCIIRSVKILFLLLLLFLLLRLLLFLLLLRLLLLFLHLPPQLLLQAVFFLTLLEKTLLK